MQITSCPSTLRHRLQLRSQPIRPEPSHNRKSSRYKEQRWIIFRNRVKTPQTNSLDAHVMGLLWTYSHRLSNSSPPLNTLIAPTPASFYSSIKLPKMSWVAFKNLVALKWVALSILTLMIYTVDLPNRNWTIFRTMFKFQDRWSRSRVFTINKWKINQRR